MLTYHPLGYYPRLNKDVTPMKPQKPIRPDRVRTISGSFSWTDHRFINNGFINRLTRGVYQVLSLPAKNYSVLKEQSYNKSSNPDINSLVKSITEKWQF